MAKQGQHRRRQQIIAVGEARIAAITGIEKLGQIVGADRQEIDPFKERRQLPQQRWHFEHDADADRARRLAPLRGNPRHFLVEQRARLFELGDFGDHREFDVEIAPAGGAQQGAQLLPQHRRAVEADADRPPPHRRILFGRVGEIGQHLVAADIERAEHDWPVVDLLVGSLIELGLIGDIRKGVPRQQRDLGAEQADAFRAGCRQLRQIEQQAGIEQ